MSVNLGLLIVVGLMAACGVYLLLERSLVKMLLGLLLVGNAINLMIITISGAMGNPPIVGRNSDDRTSDADPLAQGMILTAIVITMGMAAFILSLAYRSFMINTDDEVDDDPEDLKVQHQRSADAPDRDRSDDPVTGSRHQARRHVRRRRQPVDRGRDQSPPRRDLRNRHPSRPRRPRRRTRRGTRRDRAGHQRGLRHMTLSNAWFPTLIVAPVLVPMIGTVLTLIMGRYPRFQRVVTVDGDLGFLRRRLPAAVSDQPRRHLRPAHRRLGRARAATSVHWASPLSPTSSRR